MTTSIAIIGGGNLGQAIASGLISKGLKPESLTISRHRLELLSEFKSLGVHVTNNNSEAISAAEVVIFAVKPYTIKEVLEDSKDSISNNHLLISVVSDFNIQNISNCLDTTPIIFRAMPNTAAAVNQSLTCIATENGNSDHTELVKNIFDSLGQTIEIKEQLMDAATVLGACGIAYVLRFIRGMIQGGIEIGFDAATATEIATQTVKGASELLLKQGNHPEAEIDKVTTPKGCTIAGLNEMEHRGFSSALIKGIKTSYNNIAD